MNIMGLQCKDLIRWYVTLCLNCDICAFYFQMLNSIILVFWLKFILDVQFEIILPLVD